MVWNDLRGVWNLQESMIQWIVWTWDWIWDMHLNMYFKHKASVREWLWWLNIINLSNRCSYETDQDIGRLMPSIYFSPVPWIITVEHCKLSSNHCFILLTKPNSTNPAYTSSPSTRHYRNRGDSSASDMYLRPCLYTLPNSTRSYPASIFILSLTLVSFFFVLARRNIKTVTTNVTK